jgi:hypothetical protein
MLLAGDTCDIRHLTYPGPPTRRSSRPKPPDSRQGLYHADRGNEKVRRESVEIWRSPLLFNARRDLYSFIDGIAGQVRHELAACGRCGAALLLSVTGVERRQVLGLPPIPGSAEAVTVAQLAPARGAAVMLPAGPVNLAPAAAEHRVIDGQPGYRPGRPDCGQTSRGTPTSTRTLSTALQWYGSWFHARPAVIPNPASERSRDRGSGEPLANPMVQGGIGSRR